MKTMRPLATVGAFVGGVLFAYTLYAAGPGHVLDQIRQIGLGFALVLALSAGRMAVRAKAWALSVEDKLRFSFHDALIAFISGDAIGNITPLGPVASESTKAILSRRILPAADAISSVLLENIFYSISVAVMVSVGMLAFAIGFRTAQDTIFVTAGVCSVAVAAVLVIWWVLRAQPRVLSRFVRYEAVRNAEDRIFRFARAHRERVGPILLLEFLFHAAAVAEIYALLWILLGHSASLLLIALILETVERLITIAFKFVPLRMGVDQAGSGLVAQIIGVGSTTGVTIATVRTARNLCWAAAGLFLLLKAGVEKERPVENPPASRTATEGQD